MKGNRDLADRRAKSVRTRRGPDGYRLFGSLQLWGWSRLNCAKIKVEQCFALVPLILPEQQPVLGKTFVFAHGSWHGGRCWRRVADRLRAQGHRAFTPSFTGMGDREHLLRKDITLETFVQDVVEVLVTEELSDLILVGHSFGGAPVSRRRRSLA